MNKMYFVDGVEKYLEDIGEEKSDFTDYELSLKEQKRNLYIGLGIGAAFLILFFVIVKNKSKVLNNK